MWKVTVVEEFLDPTKKIIAEWSWNSLEFERIRVKVWKRVHLIIPENARSRDALMKSLFFVFEMTSNEACGKNWFLSLEYLCLR